MKAHTKMLRTGLMAVSLATALAVSACSPCPPLNKLFCGGSCWAKSCK